MKSASRVAVLVVLAGLAFWFREPLTRWFQAEPPARIDAHSEPNVHAPSASDVDHFTCSMHPSVRQATGGKCPLCGMDLIPITRQQQQEGVVLIDEARRQLIGVKTEKVTRGPVQHSVRVVGRVTYDERTLTDVSLKVSGWVTQLMVGATGESVKRGQTLFTFYSPELYSAQQDFLSARRSVRALAGSDRSTAQQQREPWTKAGRQRLHLLGMDDAQIERLSKRDEPLDAVAVTAPASGFVIEKDIVQGAAISAGMRLFRIAKLGTVWVEAELYEPEFALAQVGQPVKVTLDYVPNREYSANIAFVYPYIDTATRTGRVRIELPNEKLELRPGMYANVELSSSKEDRVLVPSSAVVYTGPRRLVFLDLGNGQFKPQEVRLGTQSGSAYEVLEGVKPGDVVATLGTFLIAAEARITASTGYWDELASPVTPLAPKEVPAAGYVCPMHPEVESDGPSDCPKCGMKLVPRSVR
jgi:Cu(I)/Ag(I) efflux system membrane fusion protein